MTPLRVVEIEGAQQLVDMLDVAMDRLYHGQRDAATSVQSDNLYGGLPPLRTVRAALVEAIDAADKHDIEPDIEPDIEAARRSVGGRG